MRESGDFPWAFDFISSTIAWMSGNKHVTEKQFKALQKIASKGKKSVPKGAGEHDRKRSGLFS